MFAAGRELLGTQREDREFLNFDALSFLTKLLTSPSCNDLRSTCRDTHVHSSIYRILCTITHAWHPQWDYMLYYTRVFPLNTSCVIPMQVIVVLLLLLPTCGAV
jgi:hypothetical protein